MTIMTSSLVFQLSGTCNNYPWGKKGTQSLAARLCANTLGDKFEIDDDQFYSEMWFGDYPKFPARVLETGELLKDVLDRNKEKLLGKKVIENLDGQLPFLPKVSPEDPSLYYPVATVTDSSPDPLNQQSPPAPTPSQERARN